MISGIYATLVITAISLHSTYALTQSKTAITAEGSRAPLRSSDILNEKGIASTHASLADALHNSDPLIRTSAARVLAQTRDPEASSLIEPALASESNPKTIVELASVLVSLGDPVGEDRLIKICKDTSLPSRTVSYAASHLATKRSGTQCIDPLIKRLQDQTELGSAMELIPSLAPLYKAGSKNQQGEILEAIQSHLDDKEPTTRMVASRALVQIAFPNSADKIKKALQRETDPMVRAGMENDLATLMARP